MKAFLYHLVFLIFLSKSAFNQPFYKTPSGSKYHLSNCRMVKNVSETISIPTISKKGLTPCKICKPQFISAGINDSKSNKAKGTSNTVQCIGTTKAGNRCRHMTSIANQYCFQHIKNKN